MSPANIFVTLIFSLVGLAALRYGKQNGEVRPIAVGVALLVYGYFVSNAWISLLIGAVLTGLLFYPQ